MSATLTAHFWIQKSWYSVNKCNPKPLTIKDIKSEYQKTIDLTAKRSPVTALFVSQKNKIKVDWKWYCNFVPTSQCSSRLLPNRRTDQIIVPPPEKQSPDKIVLSSAPPSTSKQYLFCFLNFICLFTLHFATELSKLAPPSQQSEWHEESFSDNKNINLLLKQTKSIETRRQSTGPGQAHTKNGITVYVQFFPAFAIRVYQKFFSLRRFFSPFFFLSNIFRPSRLRLIII